ncbi:hypothetical protein [Actinophytocola sp. KF-1]
MDDAEVGPHIAETPRVSSGGDRKFEEYRVIVRERFDRAVVPMDRIFERDGPPRLTLVTCGGLSTSPGGHDPAHAEGTFIELLAPVTAGDQAAPVSSVVSTGP